MSVTLLYRVPKVWLHLAAWLLYTGYIYFVNYLTNPAISLLLILAYLLPCILVFYACIFCLRLYGTLSVFAASLIIMGVFALFLLVSYIYTYSLLPALGIKLYSVESSLFYLQTALSVLLQYFVYALLYVIVGYLLRKERALRFLQSEKYALERDKKDKELENALLQQRELEIQYDLLKAQINPHFLYNTLNIVYGKALDVSEGLADIIHKISELMRYSVDSSTSRRDCVAISVEMQQMYSYIDVMQLRFPGELHVRYDIGGEYDSHPIPVFTLITLVENAFKHGDLTSPDSPLHIKISLERDFVLLECFNRKKNKVSTRLFSSGLGMESIQKRLDILFKGRHTVEVFDTEITYQVSLTINYEA